MKFKLNYLNYRKMARSRGTARRGKGKNKKEEPKPVEEAVVPQVCS